MGRNIVQRVYSTKTTTNNLGDPIQIIACNALLSEMGIATDGYLDRDWGLERPPDTPGNVVLNGWYSHYHGKNSKWTIHPDITPLFFGFHIAPHFKKKIDFEYMKRWGPIGARDADTCKFLQENGCDAWVSGCLTSTLPLRQSQPSVEKTFISAWHPKSLAKYVPEYVKKNVEYVSHAASNDTHDYFINVKKSAALLEQYKQEATLVITSSLHCALPCIAMGIPVVVFTPSDHVNDVNRFGAINGLCDVHSLTACADDINWTPDPINTERYKDNIKCKFYSRVGEVFK